MGHHKGGPLARGIRREVFSIFSLNERVSHAAHKIEGKRRVSLLEYSATYKRQTSSACRIVVIKVERRSVLSFLERATIKKITLFV